MGSKRYNKDTKAADTTSTGVKSSLVVPSYGGPYVISSATANFTTGAAPTVQLERLDPDGTTVVTCFKGVAPQQLSQGSTIPCKPGETVRWNCTAAGAASATDFNLCVEEEA